jgi:hypothetical protein
MNGATFPSLAIPLLRHTLPVRTIFDLLGSREDDMTYSLGYVLSRSTCFARQLLRHITGTDVPLAQGPIVRLQAIDAAEGRTDVDIRVGNSFVAILEAKRGPELPTRGQLFRYASILSRDQAVTRWLVAITNAPAEFARATLPTEIAVQSTGPATGWTAKEVIPAVAGALGFVAAIVSIVVALKINNRTISQRENEIQKAIIQRSNESELTLLQERLDKFFGPYQQLSETKALLAREFISRQRDPAFRTLSALLDPEQRKQLAGDKNDWTILSEIMQIDGELDRMIRENAGLVDRKLLEYLARVSAHYRIIRLAYDDKVSGDPHGSFSKYYVYTWQLDKVLKLEIERLQNRCALLRRQLAVVHPPLEPLSIPEGLRLEPWPDPRRDWQAKAIGPAGHAAPAPSDAAEPKH